MSKWEITGGREDLVWYERANGLKKEISKWWVMTWIVNGSRKQSSFGAYPIWCMEDGKTLCFYTPPEHAVLWGYKNDLDASKVLIAERMYNILPTNIWARMPMEVPTVPNVDMFFNVWPFPEDEMSPWH